MRHATSCRGLFIASVALACLSSGCVGREGRRVYPQWSPAQVRPVKLGCLKVTAEGRRAFKDGAAFVATLSTASAVGCRVRLQGATLTAAEQTVPAVYLPRSSLELTPGTQVRVYLPFEYDVQAAWNDGQRSAVLSVDFDVAGAKRGGRWRLDLRPSSRSARR